MTPLMVTQTGTTLSSLENQREKVKRQSESIFRHGKKAMLESHMDIWMYIWMYIWIYLTEHQEVNVECEN